MSSKKLTLTSLKTLISLITLIPLISLAASPALAAYFTLNPQSRTVAPDETFSVDVKINTDGENVTSADALFNFNSSILSVSSITPGDFFPRNFKTTTPSQIYVGGAVQNATETRTGTGLLATINFQAIGSGTASLAFDCTAGKTSDSNITKDDRNATDILNCDQLVDGVYTVSGDVTSTQPTPTPKTLPESGSVEQTLLFAGIGIVLTIVGIMVML